MRRWAPLRTVTPAYDFRMPRSSTKGGDWTVGMLSRAASVMRGLWFRAFQVALDIRAQQLLHFGVVHIVVRDEYRGESNRLRNTRPGVMVQKAFHAFVPDSKRILEDERIDNSGAKVIIQAGRAVKAHQFYLTRKPACFDGLGGANAA